MRIAVFSTKSYDRVSLDQYNTFGHELTFFDATLNLQTAMLAAGFGVVCLFVNDKADEEVIAALSRQGVQLIALRCAGFNNIALPAAEKHGIKVVRVPAYSPEAVAEHAVALLLTLNRKTHKAYNRVRESNFSLENLEGFTLHGKAVGVVGTGHIGQAFCRIMLGFACQVFAYDKYPSEDMQQLGVRYVPFDHLLATSDIISLHCPLVPETFHLFDKLAFAAMKRGAMLINTSRGAVINTPDAIEALKNEQLGYLGIDVYEQEEKLFFKDLSGTIMQDDMIARLITFPNVLITAHQGFFTREALEQIATTTLKNVSEFEQGLPLANVVTAAAT